MTLQIPIPSGLDEATIRQLDQAAREAVAVQLYRQRKLTHGQLQKFLGATSYAVDGVLKQHGGVDDVTPEELDAQVSASQRVRGKN